MEPAYPSATFLQSTIRRAVVPAVKTEGDRHSLAATPAWAPAVGPHPVLDAMAGMVGLAGVAGEALSTSPIWAYPGMAGLAAAGAKERLRVEMGGSAAAARAGAWVGAVSA